MLTMPNLMLRLTYTELRFRYDELDDGRQNEECNTLQMQNKPKVLPQQDCLKPKLSPLRTQLGKAERTSNRILKFDRAVNQCKVPNFDIF